MNVIVINKRRQFSQSHTSPFESAAYNTLLLSVEFSRTHENQNIRLDGFDAIYSAAI